jgi:hypothetical protein
MGLYAGAICFPHLRPYRPEAEGRYALPQHEFGLDVIAMVGALRYRECDCPLAVDVEMCKGYISIKRDSM